MNNPGLYSKWNELQRNSSLKNLKEYANRINWNTEDTAIDVGCGDGSLSVLVKNYKPYTNFNYKKFIACDINENMVKFAQKNYGNENISFRILDIIGDLPDDLKGGFNHVFSFYTLNWIKDQEKAFRNIYNLLTDDGDILINLMASSAIYNFYKVLADKPKWSTWLNSTDPFESPYQYMQNPEKEVAEILKKIGFKNIDVQCNATTSKEFSPQELKNIIHSVEPFNMPKEVFDDFIEEGFLLAKELRIFNFNNVSVSFDFKALVINAKK